MGNVEACGVIVVVGSGTSAVQAVREADSVPENWVLAMERGDVEIGHDPCDDDFCVVLPGDFDVSQLDADPAVACYGRVPKDSPALARWRNNWVGIRHAWEDRTEDELFAAPTARLCLHCGHPVLAEGVRLHARDDYDHTDAGRPRCQDTACVC
jgi:hypothetical protein